MWTLKSSLSLIDSWEGIKRWKTKVMELMEPVGVPYLRRSPSVRVRLGIKRGVIESTQHQPCPGHVMLSRLCLWGFCHVFSLHCQPHRTPVPPPSSWTYTAWPSPCNIVTEAPVRCEVSDLPKPNILLHSQLWLSLEVWVCPGHGCAPCSLGSPPVPLFSSLR